MQTQTLNHVDAQAQLEQVKKQQLPQIIIALKAYGCKIRIRSRIPDYSKSLIYCATVPGWNEPDYHSIDVAWVENKTWTGWMVNRWIEDEKILSEINQILAKLDFPIGEL